MTYQRTALVRDSSFKTRAEDGNLYIEGYFAVFGSEYRMWENAIETIDEDAFDGTLDGDIRALVNHDSTLVLGRTTAGTLSLRVDRTGLWGSIIVNQADQDAVNLYERVKRGDVSQCSFGFDIIDQSTCKIIIFSLYGSGVLRIITCYGFQNRSTICHILCHRSNLV